MYLEPTETWSFFANDFAKKDLLLIFDKVLICLCACSKHQINLLNLLLNNKSKVNNKDARTTSSGVICMTPSLLQMTSFTRFYCWLWTHSAFYVMPRFYLRPCQTFLMKRFCENSEKGSNINVWQATCQVSPGLRKHL